LLVPTERGIKLTPRGEAARATAFPSGPHRF